MLGWECPKCGACFAPAVEECKHCLPRTTINSPLEGFTFSTCFHDFSAAGVCSKCGQSQITLNTPGVITLRPGAVITLAPGTSITCIPSSSASTVYADRYYVY